MWVKFHFSFVVMSLDFQVKSKIIIIWDSQGEHEKRRIYWRWKGMSEILREKKHTHPFHQLFIGTGRLHIKVALQQQIIRKSKLINSWELESISIIINENPLKSKLEFGINVEWKKRGIEHFITSKLKWARRMVNEIHMPNGFIFSTEKE